MKKVLIATHGNLADGFKSSINVLAGEQFNIQTLNAYVDNQCQDYSHEVLTFINSITKEDEGIIFTDLLSGSVNQKVCQLCIQQASHIHIITGVNLMCILGVLLESRPLHQEVLNEIVSGSQVTLMQFQDNKNKECSDDEQDFLSQEENEK